MAILKVKDGGVAKQVTLAVDLDDTLLVHKTGTEEIAGRKDFTVSPTVPTVADTTDATTKVASTEFVQGVVNAVFDSIYPVGSYAFGVKPTIGTWVEVAGDRALWLKNTVADGTTIAQALPNITGRFGIKNVNDGGAIVMLQEGAFTADGQKNPTPGSTYPYGMVYARTDVDASGTFCRMTKLDASKSSSVYKAGANVQPNAYVMKVFKRTA